MPEFLQNIDTWLFYAVNHGLSNPLFDKIMPIVTNGENWLLLYLFFIVQLLWKGGARGRIAIAAIFLTIIISDPLNSRLLKELFERERPCRALEGVFQLVGCGGGKSFPSSHATNTFAAAVVLSHYYRKFTWLLFAIAATVAFSRVYVGVHYPFDVIAGALVGSVLGLLCLLPFRPLERKYLMKDIKFPDRYLIKY
jgi:undecaprenyl-diphosphatase